MTPTPTPEPGEAPSDVVEAAWQRHWQSTARCLDSEAVSDYDRERSGFYSGYRAAVAAALPPGHVVVPREPTDAMLRARGTNDVGPDDTVDGYLDFWSAAGVWAAMIEAAANPDQPPSGQRRE